MTAPIPWLLQNTDPVNLLAVAVVWYRLDRRLIDLRESVDRHKPDDGED